MTDGLTHFIGQPAQLGLDPCLESCEVRVAVGEESVMLKDRADVFRGLARHGVETFMGDRNGAVTKAFE
jgi:hypothetical protein